jgi:hypothetical protein
VIDDQRSALDVSLLFQLRKVGVGAVVAQDLLPALVKALLVLDLVLFDTGVGACARGRAFAVMNDRR